MSSTFYRVLAVDFDGTLSEGGAAPASDVLDARSAARASGLRIVLVTGRILGKLEEVWPTVHESVDCVIAENGAVLLAGAWHHLLADPVDRRLDDALAARAVPFVRGEVLLAAKAADEPSIVASIRSLELGCQTVANRTALMVLPAGVSKGTGLFHALGHLGLSFHNTIAVGDAENDLLLYDRSELAVAVRNAVQPPSERADIVLADPDGSGVAAFVPGDVLHGRRKVHSKRWTLRLCDTAEGRSVVLPASQTNVLIAGSTGSGKSYVAGLLTRVEAHGERSGLPHRVVLGEADPTVGRATASLAVLEPGQSGNCLVTWRPEHFAAEAIAAFDAVVVLGTEETSEVVVNLAAAIDEVPRDEVARLLRSEIGYGVLTRRDLPCRAPPFRVGSRSTTHLRPRKSTPVIRSSSIAAPISEAAWPSEPAEWPGAWQISRTCSAVVTVRCSATTFPVTTSRDGSATCSTTGSSPHASRRSRRRSRSTASPPRSTRRASISSASCMRSSRHEPPCIVSLRSDSPWPNLATGARSRPGQSGQDGRDGLQEPQRRRRRARQGCS
ncbi:MAG: HAD family hydrolase [Acidimicrobiales bacterium]